MRTHSTFLLLIVAGVAVVSLTVAPFAGRVEHAQAQSVPPLQPGFPRSMSGSYPDQSSPVLSDLDNDGLLEIIVGGRTLNGDGSLGCQGWVYVYNADGTLRWQTIVRADVNTAAATADLNGDGVRDIVVGMGSWHVSPDLGVDCDGGLVALSGLNASVLWVFNTADWGEWGAPNGRADGVHSAPAIADLDNDGVLDIVFSGWDQCIYRINQYGQPLWGALPGYNTSGKCGGRGFWVEDTVWSSPALADLDGDNLLEIVIGTDITLGNHYGYPDGGVLYVLSASGQVRARRHFPQGFYSSPVIADVTGNGRPEIIIGSGLPYVGQGKYAVVARYDPSLPTEMDRLVVDWQPALAGQVYAPPALGDLNGDGVPDIVVIAFTDYWQMPMRVYGLDARNKAVLFTTTLCRSSGAPNALTYGAATVADIAGDNRPEIVIAANGDVTILNGNGAYYTLTSPACNGGAAPSTSLVMSLDGASNTPAIGDIDGDGDVEIVVAGRGAGNQGRLYAWSGFKKGGLAWPLYRRDSLNNALWDNMPPGLPAGRSTSPPFGAVWHRPQMVTVQWSAQALDYGARLAGYSIMVDNLPDTTVDNTVEVSPDVNRFFVFVGEGTWYIHLRSVDRAGNASGATAHLGPLKFDGTPPVNPAVLAAFPPVGAWSNAPVMSVTLAPGSDSASGLKGYSVVWDQSPNTPVDAVIETGPTTQIQTSTDGLGTGDWYLHIRSVDHAGNGAVSTVHHGPFRIDRESPVSSAISPASGNASAVPVSWSGSDFGGSGILSYTIQAREETSGVWMNWLTDVPSTTLIDVYVAPQCAGVYYFRSIAYDRAGNTETQVPAEGDTATSVTTNHLWRGRVTNNVGAPVFQASVQSPLSCRLIASDPSGHVTAHFVNNPGPFTATLSHPLLGPLPTLRNLLTTDETRHWVLPPSDNQLRDSHFEDGWGQWRTQNAFLRTPGHTGQYAAQIVAGGFLTQTITVTAPLQDRQILSLFYRVSGVVSETDRAAVSLLAPDSQAQVSLSIPLTVSQPEPAWKHAWLDVTPVLSNLTESSAVVIISLESAEAMLEVDEVTLGTPRATMRQLHLPVIRR